MSCDFSLASRKRAARARFREARAALDDAFRDTAAERLTALVRELDLGDTAAYVPVGSEPGSIALLDALPAQVLLPITPAQPGPLDWAEYRADQLVRGAYGLLEPSGPRLGASALDTVDTVLLPALAVARNGVRLGRGAGYYDRSLRGTARLIAVVYEHELVDELPAEPTDVPVHAALTPAGLVELA